MYLIIIFVIEILCIISYFEKRLIRSQEWLDVITTLRQGNLPIKQETNPKFKTVVTTFGYVRAVSITYINLVVPGGNLLTFKTDGNGVVFFFQVLYVLITLLTMLYISDCYELLYTRKYPPKLEIFSPDNKKSCMGSITCRSICSVYCYICFLTIIYQIPELLVCLLPPFLSMHDVDTILNEERVRRQQSHTSVTDWISASFFISEMRYRMSSYLHVDLMTSKNWLCIFYTATYEQNCYCSYFTCIAMYRTVPLAICSLVFASAKLSSGSLVSILSFVFALLNLLYNIINPLYYYYQMLRQRNLQVSPQHGKLSEVVPL